MKTIHTVYETPKMIRLLNKTYNEMMLVVKHRKPEAEQIIEDEEICQLQDLLLLLRLGHIDIWWGDDERNGRMLVLEVKTRYPKPSS